MQIRLSKAGIKSEPPPRRTVVVVNPEAEIVFELGPFRLKF
jgi:hypothetical protein